MFFDIFEELCKKKGVSPTQATIDCGAPKSNVTYWKKNGKTPSTNVLTNMANYFGVTTDYLLGNTIEKNKPLVNNDEDLTEYLEELKNRDEMRMLFSVSKECTKEEVEQAVRIIEALRKNGDD